MGAVLQSSPTLFDYVPGTNNVQMKRLFVRENGVLVEKSRETYAYDTAGRLATTTHADGTTIGYTYTPDGQLATVRDERHSSPNTFYAYDAAGRLTTVTQTLGTGSVVTTYAYDAHGNLASVTDPNGNMTTYVYDDFGQLLRQTSPVTGTTTYRYDPAGNLTSTTDANGATTTRTYDALGRVLTQTSTRGTDSEAVSWTYDAGTFGKGRLSSMTDPTGSTAYTYERRRLLLRETKTVQGTAYVTRYTYNADGDRASMTFPSGRVVTYTYDYARRPVGASLGATTLASAATYLPFGPLRGFTYGNGTTKTMTYDNRYRPLTNQLTGSGGAIASYGYTHDPASNITRIADALNAGYTRDFGYDDLNRLTTANTGNSLWGTGTYAYDVMGNLQSYALGANTAQFAYSGTTPKLTCATENGVVRTVTHDAAGNESTVGGELYLYSPRNLLSTDGLAFAYDGRGIRTVTMRPSMLVSQRYSFYTPELNLLAETNETTTDPKPIAFEYVWFAGQPLAQIDNATGAVSYYFNDHLGTPLLQTDAAASVVWRPELEPYGDLYALRAGAGKHQPLRFPGQESDDAFEPAYNIFRWYRAGWGRYTQADPLGLRPDLNLFRYGQGAPTTTRDPSGLDTLRCSRPLAVAGGSKFPEWTQHVFLYSTKNKTGCGLAPKKFIKALPGLFSSAATTGILEADDPYDASGSIKPGYACNVVSTDPAVDDCVTKACGQPAPAYSVCGGSACWDWAESTLAGCMGCPKYAPKKSVAPSASPSAPVNCLNVGGKLVCVGTGI